MNSNKIIIDVIKGKAHGVEVYRGFEKISILSKISKADIYDQVNNPRGTQRDLNLSHAKDAYQYISDNNFGYWTEVFLAIRDSSAVKFTPLDGNNNFGKIEIDLKKVSKKDFIAISRIDGNHRLHFADGSNEKFKPLDTIVSFSIASELTQDQEIKLFRDINANAKTMNTSHLDNIEFRLNKGDVDIDLYVAMQLGKDKTSPFYNMIYEGGVKPKGFLIPERTLRNGIRYMLSKSSKLSALTTKEAQYTLIKNYFEAVKKWVPAAWDDPKSVITLRGAGLWATCYIGADVIDKAIINKQHSSADMLKILKSGKNWDWGSHGDFKNFGGAAGANEIAKMVIRHLKNDDGFSLKSYEDSVLANN